MTQSTHIYKLIAPTQIQSMHMAQRAHISKLTTRLQIQTVHMAQLAQIYKLIAAKLKHRQRKVLCKWQAMKKMEAKRSKGILKKNQSFTFFPFFATIFQNSNSNFKKWRRLIQTFNLFLLPANWTFNFVDSICIWLIITLALQWRVVINAIKTFIQFHE